MRVQEPFDLTSHPALMGPIVEKRNSFSNRRPQSGYSPLFECAQLETAFGRCEHIAGLQTLRAFEEYGECGTHELSCTFASQFSHRSRCFLPVRTKSSHVRSQPTWGQTPSRRGRFAGALAEATA